MPDFLYFLFAFLVAISILIAVHEFGHFWVARRLGVKVLRYSLGFGKPLWSTVHGPDRTEYVIAALPLGGYVQMLDSREGEVAEHERHRAFNNQTVWVRIAIVAAGPAFNFLFAILAFWLMFLIGVTGIKPLVGQVEADTPAAQAGLVRGQEILAINDRPTPIWDVAMNQLLQAIVSRETVKLTLGEAGLQRDYLLDFSRIDRELDPDNLFELMGFRPWQPPIPALVGEIVEGSPAQQAGLQRADRIVRIDGQSIEDWHQLVDYVSARPQQAVLLELERDAQPVQLRLVIGQIEQNGRTVGRLGIGPLRGGQYPEEMRVHYGFSLFAATGKSVTHTWEMTALTLKMLGKLFTGEVSVKNLSSPINIARHAGLSASAGVPRFLQFLAIVSISLGILNLLPIPILDGGHLMFYVVEIIKGSPVSEQTEVTGRMIGIFLLVMLMGLAFYNDLVRIFG